MTAHRDQRYGDAPYRIHLEEVVRTLWQYGYRDDLTMRVAWLHDVVEDTNVTVEMLVESFDTDVAICVDACSGEGEERAVRNTSIFRKIRSLMPHCRVVARRVKIADRLANMRRCAADNAKQFAKYRGEYDRFRQHLFFENDAALWRELDRVAEVTDGL